MSVTRRVDERAHIGKLIITPSVQPSQSANKQAMASRRVLQPKTMHHRRVGCVSLLLSALLPVTSGYNPGTTPPGFTLVNTDIDGDGLLDPGEDCYADFGGYESFNSIVPDGYTPVENDYWDPNSTGGDATGCGTACNNSYGSLAGFVGFKYVGSLYWDCYCLFDTTVSNDPGQGGTYWDPYGSATSGPIISTGVIPAGAFCYNVNGVSPVLAQYSYYELCC